jgi:hypothetical protein
MEPTVLPDDLQRSIDSPWDEPGSALVGDRAQVCERRDRHDEGDAGVLGGGLERHGGAERVAEEHDRARGLGVEHAGEIAFLQHPVRIASSQRFQSCRAVTRRS